jgi:hypothetical protein
VEPGRSRACGALHGEGAGGEGRLIAWAAVDLDTGGVEHEHGSHVFAAASTIKLFVYSAYRRSVLDPDEVVPVARVGGSGVAEYLRDAARARRPRVPDAGRERQREHERPA